MTQIIQSAADSVLRQVQVTRHSDYCRPALPLSVGAVEEIAIDRNGPVGQVGLIEEFQAPYHAQSPPFSAEMCFGVRTCAGSGSGSVRGYLARMAACNLCLSA